MGSKKSDVLNSTQGKKNTGKSFEEIWVYTNSSLKRVQIVNKKLCGNKTLKVVAKLNKPHISYYATVLYAVQSS